MFLGHPPNDDIRCWDTHAQSEKTAGHGECDELQCGDDPAQQSPASKHLLNVMTGADHTERRTDIMHDKAIETTPQPDSAPIDAAQATRFRFRTTTLLHGTCREIRTTT